MLLYYLIDCVPIFHQPAFDHPLLQNHKIQLAPSSYPERSFDDKRVNSLKSSRGLKPIKQLWHLNGDCAEGTIPKDTYQSMGCFNLLCSGFIQVSKHIALGAAISEVSIYNGAQVGINILLWKVGSVASADYTLATPLDGGNWWMEYGYNNEILNNYNFTNNNEIIGYWPASLFTNLADYSTTFAWGEEVKNWASGGQHTTTEMGSGHFPEEDYTKASFFKFIQVVDESNQIKDPKDFGTSSQAPSCYGIKSGKSKE